ncbi:MAG: hypothetical protein LC749_04180 [Actinobacteria bacterium]|nr:hypothetical protein [Actinomycetota bacterium]
MKLPRTIRHYRSSIEATIERQLTNGIAESNNASIGGLISRVRSAQGSDRRTLRRTAPNVDRRPKPT